MSPPVPDGAAPGSAGGQAAGSFEDILFRMLQSQAPGQSAKGADQQAGGAPAESVSGLPGTTGVEQEDEEPLF
jgi:hypothetical protein